MREHSVGIGIRLFFKPVAFLLGSLYRTESVDHLLGRISPVKVDPHHVDATIIAVECLLDQLKEGLPAPSLIIGMPVGFVGVAESKRRLAESGQAQIRLEGSRGGAGLVAAAVNALLRASVV